MRLENRVRKQLNQVLYRHLQKILRANFKCRPHTCKYNRLTQVGEMEVGVCDHPDAECSPIGTVLCDARTDDGVQQAKECPFWEAVSTKDEIKDAFSDLIHSGDRGRIAIEYPDVAALMWVLDDGDGDTNLLDILAEEEPA